jgi:hypothetical protein
MLKFSAFLEPVKQLALTSPLLAGTDRGVKFSLSVVLPAGQGFVFKYGDDTYVLDAQRLLKGMIRRVRRDKNAQVRGDGARPSGD